MINFPCCAVRLRPCVAAILLCLLAETTVAQIRFTVTPDTAAQRVEIAADGQPFTAYIFPRTVKKPVLYPLRTPDGTVVTRGFPLDTRPGERVDHPHHVGLWLNYGDVNGYDFWNNSEAVDPAGKYGAIYHREILEATDGERGVLHVTADWITSDGNQVLEEDTRFVFSAQNENTYLIDRFTTLTAVGDVSLTDNKEGMLGVRVARALEHPSDKPAVFTDASGTPTQVAAMNNAGVNGLYRSSKGVEGEQVWGTRARWVQLSGRIDEQPSSITIIDHPDNVGFPTYWHARGYGLFAANPLGQEALSGGKDELNFALKDGEAVTFRYRVVLHAGESLSDEQQKNLYGDFSKSK
ncbi:MAG: PmoA family protein [Tunicatimonas sp.]